LPIADLECAGIDGALDSLSRSTGSNKVNPKRRRAALAAALQKSAIVNRKYYYGFTGFSTTTLLIRRVEAVARCKSARALL
jgi:hypothetical protein